MSTEDSTESGDSSFLTDEGSEEEAPDPKLETSSIRAFPLRLPSWCADAGRFFHVVSLSRNSIPNGRFWRLAPNEKLSKTEHERHRIRRGVAILNWIYLGLAFTVVSGLLALLSYYLFSGDSDAGFVWTPFGLLAVALVIGTLVYFGVFVPVVSCCVGRNDSDAGEVVDMDLELKLLVLYPSPNHRCHFFSEKNKRCVIPFSEIKFGVTTESVYISDGESFQRFLPYASHEYAIEPSNSWWPLPEAGEQGSKAIVDGMRFLTSGNYSSAYCSPSATEGEDCGSRILGLIPKTWKGLKLIELSDFGKTADRFNEYKERKYCQAFFCAAYLLLFPFLVGIVPATVVSALWSSLLFSRGSELTSVPFGVWYFAVSLILFVFAIFVSCGFCCICRARMNLKSQLTRLAFTRQTREGAREGSHQCGKWRKADRMMQKQADNLSHRHQKLTCRFCVCGMIFFSMIPIVFMLSGFAAIFGNWTMLFGVDEEGFATVCLQSSPVIIFGLIAEGVWVFFCCLVCCKCPSYFRTETSQYSRILGSGGGEDDEEMIEFEDLSGLTSLTQVKLDDSSSSSQEENVEKKGISSMSSKRSDFIPDDLTTVRMNSNCPPTLLAGIVVLVIVLCVALLSTLSIVGASMGVNI